MNIYSHITSMTGLIKTKIIQIKIFIFVDVHLYYPIVCKNNTCLTFILKNVRKLFKNEIRKIEDIFLWTFLHIKTFLCLASKNIICLIFFMHYSRDLEGKVCIRISTVKDPQNALLLCRLALIKASITTGRDYITSEDPCELCLRISVDKSWLLY